VTFFVQGNCEGPAPAVEGTPLRALRPQQCVLIAGDSGLFVIDGTQVRPSVKSDGMRGTAASAVRCESAIASQPGQAVASWQHVQQRMPHSSSCPESVHQNRPELVSCISSSSEGVHGCCRVGLAAAPLTCLA
jgi:hypothetical protein